MDSKRTLRSTIATLAAFTAGFGGMEAARADVDGGPGQVDAPVVQVRTWRTSAKPRVPAGLPRNKAKRFALDQVVRRSWGMREFRCLDNLWTRESGWNHRAVNRSSGAYGIPQALPAGKMRGAGKDWRHNPKTQIRWGLAYIKGRYGRPCGAWGHFRSHNWY